ncbi:MAG: hypothetical protein KDD44_10670, partial [Bdellovibrionales bacterium]|nr:hypothetical protein [Bdellovibrionales bacterium]
MLKLNQSLLLYGDHGRSSAQPTDLNGPGGFWVIYGVIGGKRKILPCLKACGAIDEAQLDRDGACSNGGTREELDGTLAARLEERRREGALLDNGVSAAGARGQPKFALFKRWDREYAHDPIAGDSGEIFHVHRAAAFFDETLTLVKTCLHRKRDRPRGDVRFQQGIGWQRQVVPVPAEPHYITKQSFLQRILHIALISLQRTATIQAHQDK